MKIHHLDVDDALTSLHAARAGLGADEALRRLQQFGPNRVEAVAVRGRLRHYLGGFTHFLALILWLAAGLAFFAEYQEPGQGMAILGAAIVGVILINGLFSLWQEHRAEQALEQLRRVLPHQVKVRRDDHVRVLPASELVPGDIVLLEAGDDVPADCRVTEAFGTRVNNATITGESVPLPREVAVSTEESALNARNVLLAGTSLVSGEATAVVFATGMQTEFGNIAHLTQVAEVVPSPLQREILLLSRWLALIAMALGVLFFLIGQGLGLGFWSNLLFAIGIIVANVPEGLLPTVTLALAMGSQRMARRNVLIRHLPSVETLGCTSVILSDKTGTLTQNRMDITQLFIDGQRYTSDAAVAVAQRYPRVFEVARHCHNLRQTGPDNWLGDTMELALLRLARRAQPGATTYERVDEVPFDSERRRLSTLHRTPAGLILYTKGALESVLPLCRQAIGPRALTRTLAWSHLEAEEAMAQQGFRVLALACREVPADESTVQLERDLVLLGLVAFRDPPRPEVASAVTTCHEAGIKVVMVTGDHPQTALAIAREIGLVRSHAPVVVTGERLQRMSEAELTLALVGSEIVFARITADQKLRLVHALKRRGAVVAVTGDGVNDAPALRHADIGIAMGLSGTDVAREAADMVLMDDNFASIVAAVEEGRTVYANIRKFMTYILTSNVPEIVPYLAFVLFRIPLPLTIIQILAVDLGTDMLPALALGAEPPEPGVMKRPPRSPKQRLLTVPLLLRAYLFLGVMEAIAAMSVFFFVLDAGDWHYGEALAISDPLYLQATTACLSAIIAMQVVNVFLCRSEHRSVFSDALARNRLIALGIVLEIALILVIDYTALGNALFRTAPVPSWVWAAAVPFAVAMLALEELRKVLTRRIAAP